MSRTGKKTNFSLVRFEYGKWSYYSFRDVRKIPVASQPPPSTTTKRQQDEEDEVNKTIKKLKIFIGNKKAIELRFSCAFVDESVLRKAYELAERASLGSPRDVKISVNRPDEISPRQRLLYRNWPCPPENGGDDDDDDDHTAYYAIADDSLRVVQIVAELCQRLSGEAR